MIGQSFSLNKVELKNRKGFLLIKKLEIQKDNYNKLRLRKMKVQKSQGYKLP